MFIQPDFQKIAWGGSSSDPVFDPKLGHLILGNGREGLFAVNLQDHFYPPAWTSPTDLTNRREFPYDDKSPRIRENPGTPAYNPAGDRIALGDSGGTVRLLKVTGPLSARDVVTSSADKANIELIGSYKSSDGITAPPAWSPEGKYFIVGDHGGVLRCFKGDGETLELVWEKPFKNKWDGGVTYLNDGKVLLGGSEQSYLLDEKGQLVPKLRHIRDSNWKIIDTLVLKDRQSLGENSHYLYLLDLNSPEKIKKFETTPLFDLKPEDGVTKFQTENPVYFRPAVLENSLVAYGAGKGIHALDLKTGKEKWHSPTFGFVRWVMPSPDKKFVLAGCENGFLYALNSKTGDHLWQQTTWIDGKETEVPAPIYTGAKSSNLPAFSWDGKLLAFVTKMPGRESSYFSLNEASTGRQLASYELGGSAASSVAASSFKNLFSVATYDGIVHVLEYSVKNLATPGIPHNTSNLTAA